MKNSFYSGIAAVVLALAATAAAAKDWYVNDGSRTGDTYCTATGNDANDGQTPATPFLTIGAALPKLSAGDTVYVDTGTYNESVLPSVSGAENEPISLLGSTNGTFVTASGTAFFVQGSANHYRMENFSIRGSMGFRFQGNHWQLKHCDIRGSSGGGIGIWSLAGKNLQIENCSVGGGRAIVDYGRVTNHCIVRSVLLAPVDIANADGWSLQECIVSAAGSAFFTGIPEKVQHCLFDVENIHAANQYGPNYANVEEVAANLPGWSGNQMGNPCFADAAGGDYHLLSPYGYMKCTTNAEGVVTGRNWVTDTSVAYSPGIDTGLADSDYSNEPTPNGGRGNIGRYAGTGEASKSATGAALRALTFAHGGRATGSAVLEWAAANFGEGETVKVQISTNAGAKWTTLGTVAAADERYTWTITAAQESPRALWKVTSSKSAAVSATNGAVFSVRSGEGSHFDFYVNDGSRTGDVYCTATGKASNDGVTPATPKASLADLLDTYSLGAGDRVWVDTGTYMEETPVVGMLHRGTEASWVTISGSTNGTVLDPDNTTFSALTLNRAEYVKLENLTLTGGRNGLLLTNGTAHVRVEGCTMTGNYTGLSGLASDLTVEHSVFAKNTMYGFWGADGVLDHCVAYGNRFGLGCTTNTVVSNSVVAGSSESAFALYQGNTAVVPRGDYNVLWGNAQYTRGVTTLQALQGYGTGWMRSFASDPQFVDAENGDFHEGTGSALIDAGDPASTAYTNEPAPNGQRVNIGAYGGTGEAAKSPGGAWVRTYTFNDGGTLDAQAGQTLQWNAGGYASGATATIWLSRNDGQTWEVLAENVDVASGTHFYRNTDTNDPSALYARWKITLDGASGVASTNLSSFMYKNGSFHFYLNDESTDGDVYCTAPGDDANSGLSRDMPMRTLSKLLEAYTLGEGDRVYVDTGIYDERKAIEFTANSSGVATNAVQIIGSTNRAANGSQFGNRESVRPVAFQFQAGASNIVLRNVIVTNTTTGVSVSGAENITLEGVELRGVREAGVAVDGDTEGVKVRHGAFEGGGRGLSVANASGVAVENCVFHGVNNAVWLGAGAEVDIRNTVLSSDRAGGVLVSYSTLEGMTMDYNGIDAAGGCRVAYNTLTRAYADNLAAWQKMSGGLDMHSIPGDPLLADLDTYDYHLKTEQTLGRYTAAGWTSDTESSPLLDAGDPASGCGDEPAPNGGRVNIGMYGGTAEASKALDRPWLRAVSYADAGSVGSETATLRWIAGGGITGTVRVAVSRDGGTTWSNVANSIQASAGEFAWNASKFADSPAGMWRVTSRADSSVESDNGVFFAIRKAPLKIYLATADTNETVYVTGQGKPTNVAATKAAPLDSLRRALELYDLEGGDTVYVDTGTYEEEAPVVFGIKDSGTTNAPLRVVGNTNDPLHASVLKQKYRTTGGYGLVLSDAQSIRLEGLCVSNAWTGGYAADCSDIELFNCQLGYAATNAFFADAGADVTLRSCLVQQSLYNGVAAKTGATVRVYNSVVRDNRGGGVFQIGGSVDVQNSVLLASGQGRHVYRGNEPSRFSSDYNDVVVDSGAYVADGFGGGAPSRFLIDWQTASGGSNDMHSFGFDPQFKDAAADDFHPLSQYGRYNPETKKFVKDKATSKLIDMGNTTFPYAAETAPNGGRINVGLYGNTAQASRSPTNGTLTALTMSDGGTVRGEAVLYWAYNGFADNTRVNIKFSGDGGKTWQSITNGIYINQNGQAWNTTNFPSTSMGVWKIELAGNTNVYGRTETLFAIKNDPANYYVNDAATDGDVYCTAAGKTSNDGLSPATPMLSLETLLGRYKVEPGDTVYVDTGTYPRTSTLTIAISTPGATNNLVIQGSTNEAAGGSLFTNSAASAVLELSGSQQIEMRDIRLAGGNTGLALTESSSNRFYHVVSTGAKYSSFLLGAASDQNEFVQCAALNAFRTGFYMVRPLVPTIPAATNRWIGGVVSSAYPAEDGTPVSTGKLVSVASGRLYVSNSVFVANQPTFDVYDAGVGGVAGDYNFYCMPHAESRLGRLALGEIYGVNEASFGALPAWQAWSGCDAHSLVGNPLFADLAGGDLHPKSQGGRYSPAEEKWVNDEVTSPLVDTADPDYPFAAEPAPNGGRADMGFWGNHALASKTPTNQASYVIATLNGGGVVSNKVTLSWIPQGVATGAEQRVRIMVSTNGGESFTAVSNNVPSAAGSIQWDASGRASCPTMRWQVQNMTNTSWTVQSEADFLLRNGPMSYYVNDGETAGDVYCTAAGAPENSGTVPGSPLDSLVAVLERYDLEPGDTVYMDAGSHAFEKAVAWDYTDGGTAAAPAVLQGSTNAAAPTVWTGAGLRLGNVRGVEIRDVAFRGVEKTAEAVGVKNAENLVLDGVDVRGAKGNGFEVESSAEITLRHFSASGSRTNGVAAGGVKGLHLESGVLASNAVSLLVRSALLNGTGSGYTNSYVTMTNCSLDASGYRVPAIELRGTLMADYNNYDVKNGGLVAVSYLGSFLKEYNSVGDWSAESGMDRHSLSHDPQFADAAAGDFRLKSQGNGDATTSSLVDAGNPLSACTAEPDPNGGRINIGRHGNTPLAAKTPTNAMLTLVSFHDGGRASGTNAVVAWNYTGKDSDKLKISYSADGGATWTVLATGVSAGLGSWTWNTETSAQSVQAKLKLESATTNAITDGVFSVRNTPFTFYVNDGSRTGDVYCTAVGRNTNDGLSPATPMLNLNSLLEKYDLEAGDTVYIDTGTYDPGVNPWRITQADSAGIDEDGKVKEPAVVFQGATNSLLNGTVLNRNGQEIGIQVDYAAGVELRNITVSNTSGQAVSINNSHAVKLEWMVANQANSGFYLSTGAGSGLEVRRCVTLNAQNGVSVMSRDTRTTNVVVFPLIENCVFWGTSGYAVKLGAEHRATVRNSILSVSPGHYVYGLDSRAQLTADYNAVPVSDGVRVYEERQDKMVAPVPVVYESLGAWAEASGQDLHSYDGVPKIADTNNYDFHLLSQTGRWNAVTEKWVKDKETSPLIDAGAPETEFASELAPNGGRANIGLYGGTEFASKTPTNSLVRLLTLNRGGVASGLVSLNWLVTGAATGAVFDVEFSPDDGASWQRIAGGLSAALGGLRWNSSAVASTPIGRWRLTDAGSGKVWATSEAAFVLHNGGIAYYVNDSFVDGDVYCTAPGASSNTGLTPDSPKRWMSEIIEAYNLEPGDVVYVDTGDYLVDSETVWGDLDSGAIGGGSGERVLLQGSTNESEGGSRFILASEEQNGIVFDGAYGVELDSLTVVGGASSIGLSESYNIEGRWLRLQDASNAVVVNQSSNVVLDHVVLRNNGIGVSVSGLRTGDVLVNHSVLWGNRYGIHVNQAKVAMSNSIVHAEGNGSFAYYVRADRPPFSLRGDYNGLHVADRGQVAGYQTGNDASARTSVYATVSAWGNFSGNDTHSLPNDPRVADAAAGDFHLKSQGGRLHWNEDGTAAWVFDPVSSTLLDAGNPADASWTAEPDPNGRRLNIGLYGGTAEASRSVAAGTLTLLSLNDGGTASGETELLWTVGGAATNYSVCLDYSPDNGNSWTNIVCGIPATEGRYLWDSTDYGRSALGRWRAYCVENTSIEAASLSTFVLRNGGSIYYYVNNALETNDVYCTAAGDDGNDGLTTGTPKASVQAILDAYELAPEDVVLVDAGTYSLTSPLVIDQTDSGWLDEKGNPCYVTIQGSTNPAAPTVLMTPSRSYDCVVKFSYAEYVKLKDLTVRNAVTGVDFDHAVGCRLENMVARENNNSGVNLGVYCASNVLQNTILWNNLSRTGGVAVAVGQADVQLENCVLWGSPISIQIDQGSVCMTNSVAYASGSSGRMCLFGVSSSPESFSGDYNCYYAADSALIAENRLMTGGSDYYNNLPAWRGATGGDRHSMLVDADPGFVNANRGNFHLVSRMGSYPDWQADADLTNSVLIDAGCPASGWENEPEPNGGIVNIGAFGNTAQASLSETGKWVRAVSYNEGGTMSSDVLLYWNYGGMGPGTKVRLDYSIDYEETWQPIVTDLEVGQREYEWDVSQLPLCLALKWRIQVQDELEVQDATDNFAMVKTHTYDYYINDASRDGDVYCKAAGMSWYDGATGTNAASPLDSLNDLLALYPVGAGDRIFIDTGTYELMDAIRFTDQQMGAQGMPLEIIGSANWVAGGTLFTGFEGRHDGLQLVNIRYVELSNLRFTEMRNGLAMQYADGIRLSGIESFGNRTNGISAVSCGAVDIANSLLYRNGSFGYASEGQKGSNTVRNATFWGNGRGAVRNTLGTLDIRNSILVQTNKMALCFINGNANIQGDYNLYQVPEGGLVATNSYLKAAYWNLSQWMDANNNVHSWVGDPLFADAENGDFHLQSRAGRWHAGTWVVDADTSWAIDAGDPAAMVGHEPAPNGGRINLGRYGGTEMASKTDSSVPGVYPLTFRDGGVASYGQLLAWLYRGLATSNRVDVQYAPDGVTWQTVDTVRINQSPYEWLSTDDPSPEALWRVVLVGNTNVVGATDTTFIFRPKPLIYYVNDSSRTGDVYTTAVGSSTNRGYRPESPLDSVQSVFARYTLAGGDRVLIDTGTYEADEPLTLTSVHSGRAAAHVGIAGSTNEAAGGSWIVAAEGMDRPAFDLYGVSYIDLSDLHIGGFTNGVAFDQNASYCVLSNLDVTESSGEGITISQSRYIDLQRVLVRNGMTNGIGISQSTYTTMDGCVVWSNAASALIFGQGAQLGITNSVLSAFGVGNYCIESPTNISLQADYNDLYVAGGAEVASVNGMQYPRTPQWVAASRQDIHSLSADPLFADPANGDFHPRSRAGRYDPKTGRWVKDTAVAGMPDYSPLIDMGSTNAPWADEPAPNGGRRNIGLYGGTWQASKSNTNAWFQAVTAMAGGLAEGTFYLVWGWGGAMDPNADAMLWYSYDDGQNNWVYIGTAKAGAGQYYWESAKTQAGTFRWPTSPAARWKIHLTDNTNVWDMTDVRFGLHNSPFTFYLNDLSQDGDIYTTAVGNDANLGCYPAAPLLTLQALLENEDFEPTDQILVDTGTYYLGDTNRPISWEAADSGAQGKPVVLAGSTNGSVFVASNLFAAGHIFTSEASWLDIRDIALLGGPVVFNGSSLVVSNLAVSNGTLAIQSENSLFSGADVWRGSATVAGSGNRVEGLETRWGTVTLTGTNVALVNSLVYVTNASATGIAVRAVGAAVSNSTVVATRGTAVAKELSGALWLGHNILVAGTTSGNGSAIDWKDGGLVSDWNDLVAGPDAWIGSRHGKWERLAYWQTASGQDAHSVSFEPGFQNEQAGDFHLNSKVGRYKDGDWKTDGEHSPVIDLGNPSLGSGNELMPNGYRRNLGAYGGTPQASKSLTNRWVTALTANDGGVLKGSNVVLRWAAGGITGTETATIAYSADGGTTWSNIAIGVSLSTTPSGGEWTWNSAALPNSFNALWRITVDGSGEYDVCDKPFSLRNKVQAFYVNDALDADDIYCTAAGSVTNNGLTAATPKATLQAILDEYDLEGGDTVYVDSGAYPESVRVIWSRSGEEGVPVRIVGNTNLLGKTMFSGSGRTNYVFDVKASDFELSHLGLTDAANGVMLETNVNVTLSGMLFQKSTNGVVALATTNLAIRNSAFWNTQVGADIAWARDTSLENLTFALPTRAALKLSNLEGANLIQNNIYVPTNGAAVYAIGSETSILQNASMDYNLYDFGAETSSGDVHGWFFAGAPADMRHWHLEMRNDWRSAITNADLFQLSAARFDAHPKSTVGRFLATAVGGSWKKDSVTSWAVDHGNPFESLGAEPKVNGGRRNIGAYGGTVQASKSATNMWDRYDLRTLDGAAQTLRSTDPDWPLVWSAELLGTNKNENVIVWFTSTGEDPKGWIELTRCDAFSEHFLWNIADEKFLTGSGQWLITDTASNILAISSANLTITRDPLGISRAPYDANGLMRFEWKGGLGGQHYWILYSDDFGKSWCMWPARYNGPAKIHRSNFTLSEGEATSTFEDRTSYEHRTRWYTITTNDPTSMMTNGVYVP
ncbi:MAG: right-handed parallel beta-helix repeat-containing protein [Kiritimatiellae bacterium]|nr:right-handed parallel beta-helix repeat-containing protein [Kiritimatiellia bacterium]